MSNSSSSQLYSIFESAVPPWIVIEIHFFFNDIVLDVRRKVILEQPHLFPSISSPSNRSSILPQSRIFLCPKLMDDSVRHVVAVSLRSINTNARDEAELLINNISSTRIIPLSSWLISAPIYLLLQILRFLFRARSSVCKHHQLFQWRDR